MASGRTNCSTSSTTSDALHLQQTGHSTVLLGLPERSSFKCQHSIAKSITADLQGHGKSGIHGTQSKHHRRRSGSVCIDNVNWQAIQVGVRKFPESADVPIASICHRRIAATSGTTVTTWAATGAAKGVAKRETVDAKPCSDRGLGTGDRARKSGGSPKDKVGAEKVELDGHHPSQSSRQMHCSAHPGIFNVR
ncbi:hypothetical protein BO79DRAFT_236382 [Aspergillus costaricaensis CBS 115574]|uniref:Uncharacterized protein n=1 Tax=Aspergillus costaricaensis CBS 115574 TaxID=1448317 RepID=A0ACD1ILJ7_9EURO|nr:hypothetical protein BO79DRAFT_236382 [Aspergillus costaricaensis CBS 115574]RAK91269.1 hypothetical protein BO79DRAFT_236382 [Aspergillus costaricaensis CBS 115574]